MLITLRTFREGHITCTLSFDRFTCSSTPCHQLPVTIDIYLAHELSYQLNEDRAECGQIQNDIAHHFIPKVPSVNRERDRAQILPN